MKKGASRETAAALKAVCGDKESFHIHYLGKTPPWLSWEELNALVVAVQKAAKKRKPKRKEMSAQATELLDWLFEHGPKERKFVTDEVYEELVDEEGLCSDTTIDGMPFLDLNEHGKYYMGGEDA